MKTYSTKQLADAINTSSPTILEVMAKAGISPRSVSTTSTGYTQRFWGADAVKAAKEYRKQADANKAWRAANGIRSPFVTPETVAEGKTPADRALRAKLPPVEEQQSSAPTVNAANDQVLHRLAVMEQKVDTAVELLAQILDHLTKPGGDPASDAFKAFMTNAVGELAGKTDD